MAYYLPLLVGVRCTYLQQSGAGSPLGHVSAWHRVWTVRRRGEYSGFSTIFIALYLLKPREKAATHVSPSFTKLAGLLVL